MIRKTPEELFARLAACGIEIETHRHTAVFTVAESRSIKDRLPGGHSKNLFLKDRRDRLFLVVASADARIDLKRLHEVVGARGKLSFGSADLLLEVLGVEPGSVTPFSVINDEAQRVTVVLDAELMRHDPVNFHPLVNTMTTAIAPADLLVFLRALGHVPQIMELPSPVENCAP